MNSLTAYQTIPNRRVISPNLQIYHYTADAMPAILDLTRKTLGNNGAIRKTTEFWHWKHQVNPFGQSYGLYAWDETEQMAIGLRVLMRWELKDPAGRIITAVRAVDTATHPAYQRQGIFSTLTQQAVSELTAAGVHLIFNTPNKFSLPGYLKMGWLMVEKWPMFIKVLKPIRFLKNIIRRASSAPSLPEFEKFFGPDIAPWDDFVNQYEAEIPAFLSCWESERKQTGLRTPRDLTYLHWRYGQHPHIRYGVYPLQDTGRLIGFAILRPNIRYGLKEIVLTEIFLQTPILKLGQRFFKSLIKQFKGDYIIAHFAAGTFERKLLRQHHFVRVPRQGMIFTVRPLGDTMRNVIQPEAWDLTLGDLELF